MNIIKNYYDMTEALMESILNDIKLTEETVSVDEKRRNKQEIYEEAQRIILNYEIKHEKTEKKISKAKEEEFKRIAENMLAAAKIMNVNINIHTDENSLGWIIIESKYTWISIKESFIKIIMAESFITASDVRISTDNNLYKLEFIYELYDEITLE